MVASQTSPQEFIDESTIELSGIPPLEREMHPEAYRLLQRLTMYRLSVVGRWWGKPIKTSHLMMAEAALIARPFNDWDVIFRRGFYHYGGTYPTRKKDYVISPDSILRVDPQMSWLADTLLTEEIGVRYRQQVFGGYSESASQFGFASHL
jgi:hypothetical protein